MLQVARRNKWAVASIIAAAAMGGTAASQSEAKLVIDVRAFAITAGTGSISADGKTVTGATAGTKFSYRVFANITGFTDVDPDNGDGPVQDDIPTAVEGSLSSSNGGVKVSLTHAVGTGSPNQFNATGSQQGTVFDADGDGDLDIGPLDPKNGESPLIGPGGTAVQNIAYRANGATGNFASGGNQYIMNSTANSIATVTDASGADTLLQFVVSDVTGVGGQPQWLENNVVKNQVSGNTIELGAPVQILGSGAVPEPASLGLLGLGAVGLLRRRRA